MDTHTKVNIDFKPSKKMKKRRELDALVNGKLGSSRKKKNGQHELLRNDSDSTDEIEEFSTPQKSFRKHTNWRLCSTCLTLCGLFLLTICVVGVAGLIWVHIELKKDVDDLRSQLQRALADSQSNANDEQAQQADLKKTINSINLNLTEVHKQLKALEDATEALQNRPTPSPAQVVTLPPGLDALPETVASFGVQISELTNRVDAISSSNPQQPSREDHAEDIQDVWLEVQRLQDSLEELSTEVARNQSIARQHSLMHSSSIAGLQNFTSLLQHKVSELELSTTVNQPDGGAIETIVRNTITQALPEIRNASGGVVTEDDITHLQEQIDACAVNVRHIQQQILELQATVDHSFSSDNFTALIAPYINHTALQIQDLSSSIAQLGERITQLELNEPLSTHNSIHQIDTNRENASVNPPSSPVHVQPTATSVSNITQPTSSGSDKQAGYIADDVNGNSRSSISPTDVGSDASSSDHVVTAIPDVADTDAPTSTPETGNADKKFHIEGINTEEDLADQFRTWDVDGDDHVSNDELSGDVDVINRLTSAHADINHDGYYSLDELRAAIEYVAATETDSSDEEQQ